MNNHTFGWLQYLVLHAPCQYVFLDQDPAFEELLDAGLVRAEEREFGDCRVYATDAGIAAVKAVAA